MIPMIITQCCGQRLSALIIIDWQIKIIWLIILVFDSIIVIEIGGNLFLLKNVQHYNIRFGKLWKCVYVSECLATLICVLRRKK